MTARQLKSFRRELETRLVNLYRDVHANVRFGMERHLFDQDEPRDEADESMRTQLRDTQTSLDEANAARAQAMERALSRITRGEYGRCIECGGPIELPRLRAVPWAERCIDDQETIEREQRRPGTM